MKVLLPFLVSLFTFSAFAECPITSQGETTQDCPWAEIARDFSAKNLKQQAPGLVEQLRKDRSLSVWKQLWGRSVNYDENAKNVIVDPKILKVLAGEFRPPYGTEIFNDRMILMAGMEHCYGYLFSVLQTPYGYKRARWVRGEIENGFGLPADTFSPNPPEGTLFSNVTYFVGRIAFRGDPKSLELLERNGTPISALKKFNYGALKTVRLEETVETQTPAKEIKFRTDFVPMLQPSGGSDTHLLIYSVIDKKGGAPKIISAFPVNDASVNQSIQALGDNQPIQLRYNAYLEGFYGVALTGTRKLVSE